MDLLSDSCFIFFSLLACLQGNKVLIVHCRSTVEVAYSSASAQSCFVVRHLLFFVTSLHCAIDIEKHADVACVKIL
jgi:hypothetical protein